MAAYRPPSAPARASSGALRRGVFIIALAEGCSNRSEAVAMNGNKPAVKIR